MEQCDCLNTCGDDPRLYKGSVQECDYRRRNREESERRKQDALSQHQDALRWRTLLDSLTEFGITMCQEEFASKVDDKCPATQPHMVMCTFCGHTHQSNT